MDIRDRPFNLKGGGYGFLFRSEFFFRTTQEVEYFFFCHAKHKILFHNPTLGYTTKTLNQIIFFFLHRNQNRLVIHTERFFVLILLEVVGKINGGER
jgi:hypothetical protein